MSDCGDDRGGKRTHRALLAGFAALVAALALGVPGSGCLNPRPEEIPSNQYQATDENTPSEPVRESCDDNPLLAGCALPEQDSNDEPVVPGNSAEMPTTGPADFGDTPEPASGTPSAGAGEGAPPADAGADLGPDAGVP